MEKFGNLAYKRPDTAKLKQEYKALIDAMRNAKTEEEAKTLFLQMDKATVELETMYTIASIRNTVNTADPFYEAEIDFYNKELPTFSLLEKESSEVILHSPFRPQLEAAYGTILFKNAEVAEKTEIEANIEPKQKEAELSTRYSKLVATQTTEFRGEPCNFYGLLKHMQNTDRAVRKQAFEAFSAMYERVSGELDEIYGELIKRRVQMAKNLGMDSYTDLAYIRRHRFDYNEKDVEAFRKQVLDVIVPACCKIREAQAKRLGIDKVKYYDETVLLPYGNPRPEGTREELVAAAQQMYRELSPETGEFFDFMVDHELFDLETKPNKHMGGYCTELSAYKAPFIFSNFNGTSADVDVLTHEAGHAFESYLASRTQEISSYVFSTSEINEIHSMSMEHFAYPWMEKFFGNKAKEYKAVHLTDSFTSIPYLVCVDAFQHEIYKNPDMSPMDYRKTWRALEKQFMPWRDYDGNKFMEEGGFWMQKQHIFLYPFYYIEYALAQLGAYEFYGRSKQNRADAWKSYVTLCKAGGSKGYLELLKLADLHSPFAEGTVKAVTAPIIEEINNAF